MVAAAPAAGRLDVPVLRACIAVGGAFLDNPPERHLRLIDLNTGSTVRLRHALTPDLIASRGKMPRVGSVAAGSPTPYESVRGPSKAFMSSFGHGLRDELRGTGVASLIGGDEKTQRKIAARAGLPEEEKARRHALNARPDPNHRTKDRPPA